MCRNHLGQDAALLLLPESARSQCPKSWIFWIICGMKGLGTWDYEDYLVIWMV
jgi:hypothetical protein